MDFELNEDQKLLARTVADFVAKESPLERARKLRDDELGFDMGLYRQMAELGWLSLPFSEDDGGFGGGFLEVALVLEAFGRALVPEPILENILAGLAVAEGGSDEQKAAHLEPLIAGEKLLALATLEPNGRQLREPFETVAKKSGDGFVLDGEKTWVSHANAADAFVVSAKLDGETRLFLVPKDAQGLSVQVLQTIDGRKAGRLNFAGALGELLPKSSQALLDHLLDRGAAGAVAEGVGLTQRVLEITTEYLNTREQFGVKIGSFQVLQHRAVDMFVETQLIRAASTASMVLADDPDASARLEAISAAKVQLSIGGKQVTQESIQLHGGVGCTDEHDIGLFFKRMHALNTLYGDEAFHVRRFSSAESFAKA
jgi:alkylation response protein AidB-like acyl-CoA dehydrogenase